MAYLRLSTLSVTAYLLLSYIALSKSYTKCEARCFAALQVVTQKLFLDLSHIRDKLESPTTETPSL